MGTWAFVETDKDFEEFKELMSKELPVNEYNKLYNLIGDDILFDDAAVLLDQGDENIDFRLNVLTRAKEMLDQGFESFFYLEREMYDKMFVFVNNKIEELL